jgi:hypothetical protein
MRSMYKLVLFLFFIAIIPTAHAADSNSAIVKLRTSCTESGLPVSNCFEHMTDLLNWINTIRTPKPSAAYPLLVDIGPGKFDTFACVNMSNISLHGSGRDVTFFAGGSGITSSGCTDMSFQDFTVSGTSTFGAIYWNGGGNSHWSNVNVFGMGYAWVDGSSGVCSTPSGKHYWSGSRIVATPKPYNQFASGYVSFCDESWFFGSEIGSKLSTGSPPVQRASALEMIHGGSAHVYGSVLTVTSEQGVILPDASLPINPLAIHTGLAAVYADSGSAIHLHGTGIDVTSVEPNKIAALLVRNMGMVHANGAAYNLSSPGLVTRIMNEDGADVMAPYQWQNLSSPPNIVSVTGADTMVLTGTSDGHPHSLIYDNNCPPSHWYDSTNHGCLP